MRFDGATVDMRDADRLGRQLWAVRMLMRDGRWRTLTEIQSLLVDEGVQAMLPSVSARLRDLRKERFGSYTVDRRARAGAGRGLFEYRVTK
jgi:hypothetical protein